MNDESQGVNVGLHQRTERSIDHAMAFNRSLACKATREDAHLKVSSAVARARMPRMAVTIVHDVELFGVERCFEPTPNQCDPLCGQSATCISCRCRRPRRGLDR